MQAQVLRVACRNVHGELSGQLFHVAARAAVFRCNSGKCTAVTEQCEQA